MNTEDDPDLPPAEVTLEKEETPSEAAATDNESPAPAPAAPTAGAATTSPGTNSTLKRKCAGGLTADNKCRRCESGPSYKKGHHVSCPKSAYYDGGEGHAKRKSRPFPLKKPRSSSTIHAYHTVDTCKKQEEAALAEIKEAEELLKEATRKRDEALKRKEAAQKALKEAKEVVVKAELEEPDEWNTMFYKLKAYGEQHGTILFPRGCQDSEKDNEDYQALCQWVKMQRNKRDKIKWQRKAALDQLGFVWDPFEATWKDMYSELCRFQKEHGHCNVPSAGYTRAPNLPTWIATQRKNYRLMQEGRKVQLTQERIKLLEDIGFEWVRVTKSKWQNQFDDLVAYKLVHGDFAVPKDYEPSPTLKSWITLQRTHYRFYKEGKPSVLTEERVKMLNDVGFPWTDLENWNQRFQDLVAYHRLHGHCNVAPSCNLPLANFCLQQRVEYGKLQKGQPSSLTAERLSLLTNIGFSWTVPSVATTTTEPKQAK